MRELKDSHLMPAALYRKSRWEGAGNPNPMLLSERGMIQTSRQIKDFVLCGGCEERFNKGGERYAMSLVSHRGKFPLLEEILAVRPPKVTSAFSWYDQTALPNINRETLAYFALSVFWRASAHTWSMPYGTSPQIRLGPYQEPLRTYLLGLAPYPENLILMLIVCTDSASQNTFFVPTRSGRDVNTTHMFQARGMSFMMTAGKRITDALRTLCCVKG